MERKKYPEDDSMSITTKTIRNPYKEIAQFKDGMFRFNFNESRNWLEDQGKQIFGNHFFIDPLDHPLIHDLLIYAIGDKETARKRNLDLNKGILLSGPVGCGKTSIMMLIRYFFPPGKRYRIRSTRKISFEFENDGFKVIKRYAADTEVKNSNLRSPDYCFDDLGIEQVQKHFGNECDVMGEILLSRYDLFITDRVMTHLTTNLSASEIEQRYGNRVRSRMRAMFNLFAFNKSVSDKRT
ncbi:ATPase [uncultured Draconibacterium sp.]|uniref:ATPase n=1 Tax=uncultured Draconibacterium sp. TaxID=1573823 RepID=UPI002AA78E26|nr:ATPase [uncultured Draconibacterium sp.]